MESTPNRDVGAGGGLTKKQELNNHIVYMRKCVRQAKVHVVRKLVREVKKLRERKGSEEILQKCKRKADRLHSDITSIKNLNEDKVSVSALLSTSKLEDVLQNIKSTAEDRALARLIHHPSVNLKVTEYRNANPHWGLQIPVLLEKTPQKQKKSQKKLEEREQKKKAKLDPKKPIADVIPDENTEKLNVLPEASVEKKASDTISKKKKDNPKEEWHQLPTENIVEELAHKPEEPKIKDLNKSVGTVKVQVIKDWSEFDADSAGINDFKSTPNLASTKKPKSSFFVGGEDEIEDDTVRHRVQEQVSNQGWSEGRNDWKKPKPTKFGREFGDTGYDSKPNLFGKPKFERKAPRYFDNKTDFVEHSSSARNTRFPVGITKSKESVVKTIETKINAAGPAEKLHPSWEAKKRQSLNITSFQGKKIKFD